MKTIYPVLIAAACLLGFLAAHTAADEAIDVIPVIGADMVFRAETATSLPPDLASLVDELPDRFTHSHGANAVYWFEIAAPGDVLRALIDQLPSWIPSHGANAVFHSGDLVYPVALIGDTIPPQIYNFEYEPISGLVQWETDEFAVCEVWYGEEFGDYPGLITSTTWLKIHQFLLPTPGVPYLLIRCTDRSGNTSDYYEPGFQVSGRCADEAGNPVQGVRLSLSPTQVTVSDQNGDFALRGVPAGEHLLTPWHPAYTFHPPTRTVSVPPDAFGQDFEARLIVPPEADFAGEPQEGTTPLTVVFSNTSSGTYDSSLWYFGDGITSTLEHPVHEYTQAGAYSVALTVSGLGGTDTLTRTNYITVYEPVQAGFDASPTVGVAPLTVAFTNESSGDFDASLWQFGDGATSTLEHPVHEYTHPGVYTVTLTVSGPGGTDTLTRAHYITVFDPPVHADFLANPTAGLTPLKVVFTNASTGDYDTSLWQFGDGITSTLQSPIHTYWSPGTYTITLTVSGPGGTDTEIKERYIKVDYGVFLPVLLRGG